MTKNQYTYEWTEEDQKRHDDFVNRFSVSKISPVCLIGSSDHPNEAGEFLRYIISEVSKCSSSVAMYNRFISLTSAWRLYWKNHSAHSLFSVTDVLKFV